MKARHPLAGDTFLLAIGDPHVLGRVAKNFRAYGARFLTLVHPTAILVFTTSLGAAPGWGDDPRATPAR